MRIAYFDCFSGISGDMTLGALLHAGVDETAWRAETGETDVPATNWKSAWSSKEGISAMDVDVRLTQQDDGHGRHLKDIAEILDKSGLSEEYSQARDRETSRTSPARKPKSTR
jgi:uncharacterized protein (DUF111 family)